MGWFSTVSGQARAVSRRPAMSVHYFPIQCMPPAFKSRHGRTSLQGWKQAAMIEEALTAVQALLSYMHFYGAAFTQRSIGGAALTRNSAVREMLSKRSGLVHPEVLIVLPMECPISVVTRPILPVPHVHDLSSRDSLLVLSASVHSYVVPLQAASKLRGKKRCSTSWRAGWSGQQHWRVALLLLVSCFFVFRFVP